MSCYFDKGNRCTALKQKDCEDCNFYKTASEVKAGREKTDKRLISKGLYGYYSVKYNKSGVK